MPETKRRTSDPSCSFCGKGQHEVKNIIAATPGKISPAICSKCVEFTYNIIIEENGTEDGPSQTCKNILKSQSELIDQMIKRLNELETQCNVFKQENIELLKILDEMKNKG